MSIYSQNSFIPYCYYIKWSNIDVGYYGCRYAANANPSDFFVSYFTSSKYVKEFIINHGMPDVIQIRKTFKTVEECRDWEGRFLTRVASYKNPKLLNRANPGAYGKSQFKKNPIPPSCHPITANLRRTCLSLSIPITLADEIKDSISNRYWACFKNVFQTYFQSEDERNEFLLHNQEWVSGRIIENSTRDKLRNVSKGKPKPPRTKDHIENHRKSNLGKKKPGSGPKFKYQLLYFLNIVKFVDANSEDFCNHIDQGWSTTKETDLDYLKYIGAKHYKRYQRSNMLSPLVLSSRNSKNIGKNSE